MNIFIINLKKDTQKKEYMLKLCKQYNLQIEFIDAIHGSELEQNIISTVYSKEESIRYFSRELTKGEIGTALSHLSIYKKMIKENIYTALILEDDVDFNFTEKDIVKIIDNLPKDWECVLLGHHTKRSRDIDTLSSIWDKKKITKNLECNRLAEEAFGAYGYLINQKGALKSLQRFNIIDRPIDHWNDNFLNLYAISPSIIKINYNFEDNSSLDCDRKKADEYITRTSYEKVKDLIRHLLDTLKLDGVYYLIRNFFIQFKPLKKYEYE